MQAQVSHSQDRGSYYGISPKGIYRPSMRDILQFAPPAGIGVKMQGPDVRPFSPLVTFGANLTLWLDAQDSSTLLTTGALVNTWNDKSGNGHHMGGVGATRPSVNNAINTHQSVTAASGNTMNSSTAAWTLANIITASAWTCWVVWIYTGARVYTNGSFGNDTANPMMIEDLPGQDWGTPVGDNAGHTFPIVGSYNFAGGANETNVTGAAAPGTAFQSQHRQSAGSLFASISGGAESSTATGNIGTLTSNVSIFATGVSAYVGSLGEVIVINRNATLGEQDQVQAYYHGKWGVT